MCQKPPQLKTLIALHSRKGISFDTSQSENQRIQPQSRKEDNPFSPRKKHECLSRRMVVEDRANFDTNLRQVH